MKNFARVLAEVFLWISVVVTVVGTLFVTPFIMGAETIPEFLQWSVLGIFVVMAPYCLASALYRIARLS